ncbi:MAG: S23 ribosomal protein [Chloroflexi bacterium ADurb.Bin222]|jgi:four helix bundle suffix protein|nr:MAG: S23 ribosomal protein [Chloroflexi bacterium ADurb.Bin222]
MTEPLIPKHGGYRHLKSFQVSEVIYDLTVRFCDRWIRPGSRTHDQMVQAARSGRQNIAEGSQDSATSKKMELKLTQVARGSLEELKLDYEDYLRQNRLPQWERNDPRRQALIDLRPATADDVVSWAKRVHQGEWPSLGASTPSTSSTPSTPDYPEIAANGALALIAVATALLDRQVASLARQFSAEGGFTEQLYRVRSAQRKNSL